MSSENSYYKIGQLAKLYDISPDILRHYDRIGLLKPGKITTNGYRYYCSDSFIKLEMILTCRSLDMSLMDIKELICSEEMNAQKMDESLTKQEQSLNNQIQKLTKMLCATKKYRSFLNSKNKRNMKWELGKSPEVKYIASELKDDELPDYSETMSIKSVLGENAFSNMTYGILNRITDFDGDSYRSKKAMMLIFEDSLVSEVDVLSSHKAYCSSFYGTEKEIESYIIKGLKKSVKEGYEPEGTILETDNFVWREVDELAINTNIFIFIK